MDKSLISKEDWEEASSDFKMAQARYEVARRGLQNWPEPGMKRRRGSWPRTAVPYPGIPSKRAGEIVLCGDPDAAFRCGGLRLHPGGRNRRRGAQRPTFVTIVDLKRLQLDAYVDEVDIGRIKVGQKGVFSVDAFPDREFQGRVTAIYPQAVIQDNVVTYDCIVSIDTPYAGLLRPQMTANVMIMVENRENVLVLPVSAVKRRAGKRVVFRPENPEEEVPVSTGWQDDSLVEITSGLSEGETVLLLPPGGTKK